MKAFNLYYKSRKINNYPLSQDDLNEIMKNKIIYKKNNTLGKIEKIETKDIVQVRCIVV